MRHPIIQEDLDRILAAPIAWSAFEGKTVLITGANGFLPAYMAETLLRLNETSGRGKTRVIALARNRDRASARFSAYQDRDDLAWLIQDVCAPLELTEPVHYIIHAASQASPKYYRADPAGTLNPNVIGTHLLLCYAQQHPIEGFLFFSSGEAYGHVDDAHVPTSEHSFGGLDPADVRSCYAESKRMGETLCAAWQRQHGVPAVIVRPFHTYGPGMRLDDGRVFADFVADVVHGRDVVMRSDGRASRAFCYLADAVEGFFTVLLRGARGEAYNVGNDRCEVTILELANTLAGLFPEKRLSVVRQSPTPDGYLRSTIARSCPDIRKIRALGWQPTTGIAEGFARTIRSFL